jgi:WD40 repeat protein
MPTNQKQYHQNLAKYFMRKSLYFDEKYNEKPNVRKLVEQPWQQAKGNLMKDLESTLMNFSFIQAKVTIGQVQEMIKDYKMIGNLINELSIMHDALQLSSHILKNKPFQLSAQLTGRLISYTKEYVGIDILLNIIKINCSIPWLRPLKPTFINPGKSLIRTFNGHTDRVIKVFLNKNGKLIISSSYNGTIKIFDVNSGVVILTFEIGNAWVASHDAIVFNPESNQLITGFHNKIKFWDIEAGKEIRIFEGHSDFVTSLSISKDGKRLASGSGDKTIKIWDIVTGIIIQTICGHSYHISSVSINANGKRLASFSGYDRIIKIWDIDLNSEIKAFTGHYGLEESISLSDDGNILIWIMASKFKLFNVNTGDEIRAFKGHTDPVTSVYMYKNGRQIVSCSKGSVIKLWNINSGEVSRTFEGHSSTVSSLCISEDGKYLFSGSYDKTIKIWKLDAEKEHQNINEYINAFRTIYLSLNGQRLVSAGSNYRTTIWDVSSGHKINEFPGYYTLKNSGFVDSKCNRIALDSEYGIKIYNIKTAKEIGFFNCNSEWNNIYIRINSNLLVSGSRSKIIRLWDINSKKEIQTFTGHSDEITTLFISNNGNLLASGSGDGIIKVWNIATGKEVRTLKGLSAKVISIDMSDDNKYLFSEYLDYTLWVWDINSGNKIGVFNCHSDLHNLLSFKRINNKSILGIYDNTIKQWDIETGREIKIFKGHSEQVTSIFLSVDNSLLISGSIDKTIKIWDIENNRIINEIETDWPILCVAITTDIQKIIAGDTADHLHFFKIENYSIDSALNKTDSDDNEVCKLPKMFK